MPRTLLAGGLIAQVITEAIASTRVDGVDATAAAALIALGCLPAAYRLADHLLRGLASPPIERPVPVCGRAAASVRDR